MQSLIARLNGMLNPAASLLGTLTCARHPRVKEKMHQNWNRQSSGQVKRGEDLNANVKVSSSLFNRREVSKVILVTKMKRSNGLTRTNKLLVVADVGIAPIVMLNYILQL